MILGFDHLAVSARDLDAGLAAFPGETVFVHRGVPNVPGKRPLLADHRDLHDLALVRPARGPALEITCHGPVLQASRGPYSVLEDGRVGLSCPDPALELDFWLRGMAFGAGSGPRTARLSRPVPAWCCEIALLEGPDASGTLLDSEGHPCAAFLVSSLERDLATALAAGGRAAVDPFRLEVNGNGLAIAFLRSPCGALIELVQMERKSP